MFRQNLCLSAFSLLLAATACKAPVDAPEADGEEGLLQPEATRSAAEQGAPQEFRSQVVETPEGVRSLSVLPALDDLSAQWVSCTAPPGVVIGAEHSKQPITRLLVDGERVYVVMQNSENETSIAGYRLELSEATCVLQPRLDFAEQGVLELGGGTIDVDLFGELLVSTGIRTRVHDRDGKALELCEQLPSLTRVRGHGAHGIARRGGDELIRVTIDDATCTMATLPALAGEEALGMQIAMVSDENFFATLQLGNVPNALGYFEAGQLVWRYFPAEDTASERANLISSITSLGENALVIRSLPRHLQVLNTEGERRLAMDLNADPDFERLTYPYVAARIDDHQALVAFRTHAPDSEVTTASLRVLQLSTPK